MIEITVSVYLHDMLHTNVQNIKHLKTNVSQQTFSKQETMHSLRCIGCSTHDGLNRLVVNGSHDVERRQASFNNAVSPYCFIFLVAIVLNMVEKSSQLLSALTTCGRCILQICRLNLKKGTILRVSVSFFAILHLFVLPSSSSSIMFL